MTIVVTAAAAGGDVIVIIHLVAAHRIIIHDDLLKIDSNFGVCPSLQSTACTTCTVSDRSRLLFVAVVVVVVVVVAPVLIASCVDVVLCCSPLPLLGQETFFGAGGREPDRS